MPFSQQGPYARCLRLGLILATAGILGGCKTASVEKVTIQGSSRFVRQTQDALALLKDKAPDAYQKVQAYVGLIKEWPQSGMWATLDTPMFAVADRTAYASLTWYASAIAHDATHSELYHQYLAAHGPPVPAEVWSLVESERISIAYELDVAKRIGAPSYEIEYLGTLDGTHHDVNGDGKIDWRDQLRVNW